MMSLADLAIIHRYWRKDGEGSTWRTVSLCKGRNMVSPYRVHVPSPCISVGPISFVLC